MVKIGAQGDGNCGSFCEKCIELKKAEAERKCERWVKP